LVHLNDTSRFLEGLNMTVQARPQSQILTYRCPHCGTVVSVEPHAVNSLLSCPSPACGKMFRVEVPVARPVNAPAAATSENAPATPSPTPSYRVPEPAIPASDKEEELHTVHLGTFRRYPWRCLGYLLVVVGGITGMISFLFYSRQWLALLCVAVAAIAALRLGAWSLRMNRTVLTITNRRGILSSSLLRRSTTEFELDQVADMHVHQSTLMRWLDVGDVAIVSTNPQHPQLVIMAVPHPKEVTDLIQAHLDARRRAATAGGGQLGPGTAVSVPGPVRVE
jgi:hypothetical protein